MALSANTIYELRTNGNDTNGGAFAPAVTTASTKTDLVVDATFPNKVSSAGYGFTSVDVGRWIAIVAGTGWTLGYYVIKAVVAGLATLDKSPAAVGTTAGSVSIFYGLDYSQQDTKNTAGSNISVTNAVAAGTTTITSSTAAFTADIVGNVIYLAGGSGSLTGGWYAVSAYNNATTITVDRTVASGTGITMNIGGALATFATLNSIFVAGGKVWVKADGTYQPSANVSFGQNGVSRVIGYTTTRGDNGRATVQLQTTTSISIWTLTAGSWVLENFFLDCNSLTGSTGLTISGANTNVRNCKVANYGTIGISCATSQNTIWGNEITGGLAAATAGISCTSTADTVYGNYVHDGGGVGISNSGSTIGNIVANMTNSGDGIRGSVMPILFNTVYGCGGIGINTNVANWAVSILVFGNLVVNNTSYGFQMTTSSTTAPPAFIGFDGNAFYGNSANRNNADNWNTRQAANAAYVNTQDVTLTGNPFTNAAGGDFTLNNTAGAGASCKQSGPLKAWPGLSIAGASDMGAVQSAVSLALQTVGYASV